jgi:MoaA/NifB/PqqE/SkfB family radical SAM enzyme
MGNFGRLTVKRYLRKNYHYIPDTILKKIATPKNIIVEPIAGCNVVCSACPCDILKRPYGLMKFSTFRNVVDKTHPTKIGLYFMGEPFLNPEIFRMIRYAKSKGVRTVVNTNGTTLLRDFQEIVDSELDKITISFDGLTQEIAETYRKGINIEEVIKGFELLSHYHNNKVDSHLHIQVRSLLFKPTLSEIDDIKDLVNRNGVSDHCLIKPILTGWGGKENKDLDILGDIGHIKKAKPESCPSLFRMAVLWNGDVVPCCNDVHGENIFGNINDDSWMNIMWNNNMWKKKMMREFDICNNCYEDEEQDYENTVPEHTAYTTEVVEQVI